MNLSGRIVFASGKSGDFDIWTLDLESQELKQLTTGDYWNDSPKWSPDGKQIVFVSNRSGVPELWLMDSNGAHQTALTSAGKLHLEPSWTPDGKRILCGANYDNPDNIDIYAINADGSGKPELIISHEGYDCGPCCAPDGETIAFSSTRGGSEDIWEYNLRSKELRQVTSHPARDYSPAYSPDGSWLAFITEADENSAQDASADSDVWIVSRDGMQERPLTTNTGADRYVAWSPDGRFIVCCSRKKRGTADRLTIVEVASGKAAGLAFDRTMLEIEAGATARSYGLFALLPQALTRSFYGEHYFGSERYPHWTK